MKREGRASWPDFEAEDYFGVGPSDGLLVIYSPPERRQKLVVLVHGMGGDRFETWGHMPQLLFEDFGPDGVDIGLAGYRSGHRRLFRPDTSSFKETAASLAGELKDSGYREIILFGHSLGGLVCRQTIRHLNDIGELNPEDGPQIVGSISFASPFAGTTKSGFPIRYLHPDARLLAAFSDTTTELKTFWAAQVEGKEPKIDLEVFAAWAQYDQLVRTASAIDGVEHSNTKEVTGADHSSLVKPTDSGDAVYEWVYGRVRDIFFGPAPTDRDIESLQVDQVDRSAAAAAAGTLAGAAGAEIDHPAGNSRAVADVTPGVGGRTGDEPADGPPDFDERPSRNLRLPALPSAGGGGGGRRLLVGAIAALAVLAALFSFALLGDSDDEVVTEAASAPIAEPTLAPTVTPTPEPDPTVAPQATAAPTAIPTPATSDTTTTPPRPTATPLPDPEPTATSPIQILPGAAAIELSGASQSGALADTDRELLAAAVAAVTEGSASHIQINVPGAPSDHPGFDSVLSNELAVLTGCDHLLAVAPDAGDGDSSADADDSGDRSSCFPVPWQIAFTQSDAIDEQLAHTGASSGALAIVGSAMVASGALLVRFAREVPPTASNHRRGTSRRGRAGRR